MIEYEFILPKMGESIVEATIINWHKEVGDFIEKDESIVEIATDKVDSELPSAVSGKLLKILYKAGEVVTVGSPLAIIQVENEEIRRQVQDSPNRPADSASEPPVKPGMAQQQYSSLIASEIPNRDIRPSVSTRFYSPLIRTIAEIEEISVAELDSIQGSGAGGRITKKDLENFLVRRSRTADIKQVEYQRPGQSRPKDQSQLDPNLVELVEMDRTRQLIAEHMVRSKRVAPHVTSFLEIDVTELVEWRRKVKDQFGKKYGEKITFTPLFIEAVVKAIRDFPRINASVEGKNILIKKYINVGMATATADDNLIVPVLKNLTNQNLVEIVRNVNDLARRAREGKLRPEEIADGTFTITNVGSFGNTLGTPIINQPQAAILSTGAIRRKPGIVSDDSEERIEVRDMMFLSLSYDHRIVDGALGGKFLRRVGDYLETFDDQRAI